MMGVFQFCFQEQLLSRVAISVSYEYSFELTVESWFFNNQWLNWSNLE